MTILVLEVSDASHSTMEQETVCLAKRHSYSLGLHHTHSNPTRVSPKEIDSHPESCAIPACFVTISDETVTLTHLYNRSLPLSCQTPSHHGNLGEKSLR